MLELLTTMLGSIFSGGATGLIGIAIQRYADHKNKQQDIFREQIRLSNEVKLRKLDFEIMEKEWAGRTRIAQLEMTGAADITDSRAFAESFKMEPQRYAEGIKPPKFWRHALFALDWLRGFVRPGLTLYLCVLTTMIYFQARDLLNKEDLSSTEVLDIERLIISTILYLTTTCVLWHFGTRNKQSAPKT